MEVKEPERTVIVKPVASRPTISNFRSFSELLAGAINDSPSSEPTVTTIRPKTVRFKPVVSSPPVGMVSSQAELAGTQDYHPYDKVSKFNCRSPLLYKPLAKTVSRTTASMLANMEIFQAAAQNLASQSETVKSIVPPNLAPMKSANDKKSQLHTDSRDRPSYDGYNWRKYGQKLVKGSGYPRSYYKCTHPNCPVKKKVERSIDGEIAEIVYKGEHNHSKPRLPRRHTFDGTTQDSNPQFPNNQLNFNNGSSEGSKKIEVNKVLGSSSHLINLVKVPESYHYVSSEEFGASMAALDYSCGFPEVFEEVGKVTMEAADDEPTSKRRTILNQSDKGLTNGEGLQEPQIVVQNGADSDKISDGFRWRKYGQKVVKGNPYPRSYYRCTGLKCNVRKHVERASDDPTAFITTYEGKHNHDMPIKKANLTSEHNITHPAIQLN